jgi:hypothetical protein
VRGKAERKASECVTGIIKREYKAGGDKKEFTARQEAGPAVHTYRE